MATMRASGERDRRASAGEQAAHSRATAPGAGNWRGRGLVHVIGLSLVALSIWAASPVSVPAQTIVSSINGDPITDLDIGERMKMLKVLRKPATREAAIESLYSDRLESREAAKFGVRSGDAEASQEIVNVAQALKVAPEALVGALQQAGVSSDHFKAHFSAEYAFAVLVHALNKGVDASEEQVRAELAKQGGKAAAGPDYTVRQVIFTVPTQATVATLNERAQEAEQLRARFVDCESGTAIARELKDVTVRDPVRRSAVELGEGLRQLLDKTPVGHLTPPARAPSGLEMLAVCAKDTAKDTSAARAAIAQKILDAHIAADKSRRLKELRAKAVIVAR
jgi:peptidyl-prolyl cis-trans isomerase SurA